MCNRLPEINKNGDAGIFPVYYSLKQHSPNQSAREKLARLSRGFIHALGIPMRARGHGLHGRRKLVDPIGPPAKKLQQI